MTFYGWTSEQWAHAAAMHKRLEGSLPPPTQTGAIRLSQWWRGRRADTPLEMQIAGAPKPDMDWQWALDAMTAIAMGARA
jgi:hypothetical protein